ncbi:Cyclin-dependent kinase inhibitor 3, partial [Cucurbita argyrosperma subsp. sororia]
MGKYMKKSKLTGDIALMEVSMLSSQGLRPRAAKILALQRLNKSSSQSVAASSPTPLSSSSSSYLHLRRRRLENGECCRARLTPECSSTGSRLMRDSVNSEKSGNVSDVEDCREFGGENWGTAEKIHGSMAKDSSTNETPLSTRTEMNSRSTKSRGQMELLKSFPTANDIEEFFAQEELWQQRTFIQKYNFDFASDMPLPGRYEWVQVAP